MSDPILKAAMEEIKPILKKYDCAAIVLLSSSDNMEFLYELSPTWSCAKLNSNGELRIRAKANEYPDKSMQKRTVEKTTGIFFGFLDLLEKAKRDMSSVANLLASHFKDITHWSKEEHD